MTALAAERSTVRRGDATNLDLLYLGLADNVKVYQGAIAVLNPATGYISPGAAAQGGQVAVGRAEATADNTVVGHAAGAVSTHVRQGCFYWISGTAGDAITAANIGSACYVIDDQTVGLTDSSGTRALAGIILDYDANRGVLVQMAADLLPAKIRGTDVKPVAATDVMGGLVTFRKTFAAPGAGAQDVTVWAAAAVPFKCRVVDTQVRISGAGVQGADTATLRSAAAGGGTALSSALPTGVVGRGVDDLGATQVVATTDGMFLRLTDGSVTGEVIVTVRPEL